MEALTTALYDMPPIAPGQIIKIEIYNNGHNLITTVTFPDKDSSLMCTCQVYFLLTAFIIIAIFYLLKWLLSGTSKPTTPPAIQEDSETNPPASNVAVKEKSATSNAGIKSDETQKNEDGNTTEEANENPDKEKEEGQTEEKNDTVTGEDANEEKE